MNISNRLVELGVPHNLHSPWDLQYYRPTIHVYKYYIHIEGCNDQNHQQFDSPHELSSSGASNHQLVAEYRMVLYGRCSSWKEKHQTVFQRPSLTTNEITGEL